MSQGPLCVLTAMADPAEREFVTLTQDGVQDLPWPERRRLVQQAAEVASLRQKMNEAKRSSMTE